MELVADSFEIRREWFVNIGEMSYKDVNSVGFQRPSATKVRCDNCKRVLIAYESALKVNIDSLNCGLYRRLKELVLY